MPDSNGRIVFRFLPKESDVSEQEAINEVNDDFEEQMLLRRDSMVYFN